MVVGAIYKNDLSTMGEETPLKRINEKNIFFYHLRNIRQLVPVFYDNTYTIDLTVSYINIFYKYNI